jgi:hypothetical protein
VTQTVTVNRTQRSSAVVVGQSGLHTLALMLGESVAFERSAAANIHQHAELSLAWTRHPTTSSRCCRNVILQGH